MPGRLTLSRRSAETIRSKTPTFNTSAAKTEKYKNENQFSQIHNLNELDEITLQNSIECLQKRFADGIFYTYAGSLLISLNPNSPNSRKSLSDIDHMSFVKQYNECNEEKSSQPHVFSVGKKCLKNLRLVDQVVIVSGDSGAGKTTVTQQLLCFFIDQSCQIMEMKTPSSLDKKIYLATIILEALGNASTTSNLNSSRFGRLIQLDYDGITNLITGAQIRTCLLEKHRVAKFAKNERNFHIIYYILAALKNGVLKFSELLKGNNEDWNQNISVELQDAVNEMDIFQFQSLHHAFNELKLMDELKKIFRVVYGILMLINVSFIPANHEESFTEDFPSETQEFVEFVPKEERLIQTIANVFGIDETALSDVLISNTIVVHAGRAKRQSIFRKPCRSKEECQARVAALTSLLYNSLFQNTLSRLNSLLKNLGGCSELRSNYVQSEIRTLSLLDLYGFENLEPNHLEQLCINYANERLQLVYLQTMKTYAAELQELGDGFVPIELTKIESESVDRIQEIHETIFLVLNEACLLKRKVSEIEIFQRLKNLSKKFIESSNIQQSHCPFLIKHYATKVQYSFAGMIDKNSDNVPTEIQQLFHQSSIPFVRALIPVDDTESRNARHVKSSSKREKTILQRFKVSVDELVSELSDNTNQDLHFIRCIRPNDSQSLGKFSPQVVSRQLFTSGIVNVIKIAGNGYPIRIQKSKFAESFPAIFFRFFRTGIEGVADTFSLSSMDIRIGSTKFFFSEEGWNFLTKLESILTRAYVLKIQKGWKRMIERRSKSTILPNNGIMLRKHSFLNESNCDENQSPAEVPEFRSVFEFLCDSISNHKKYSVSFYRGENFTAHDLSQLIEKLNLRLRNGIITRGQLPDIPVRFHTRKTVLEFSHCLPKSQGLNELVA